MGLEVGVQVRVKGTQFIGTISAVRFGFPLPYQVTFPAGRVRVLMYHADELEVVEMSMSKSGVVRITTSATVDDVEVGTSDCVFDSMTHLVRAIQNSPSLAVETVSGRMVFGRHIIAVESGDSSGT